MKKIVPVLIFLMMGLSVFAQQGLILGINGTVELKYSGTQDYVIAKIGDKLGQDTLISTGSRSSALIEVESTRITVRPLTRLVLAEIEVSDGIETLNMNLQAGRIRLDITVPEGAKASTLVSSPLATASVRGTSFEFDTRNLYVNQGAVSFIGNQGIKVLVNTGAASRAEKDGKAVDPVEIRVSGLLPSVPAGKR